MLQTHFPKKTRGHSSALTLQMLVQLLSASTSRMQTSNISVCMCFLKLHWALLAYCTAVTLTMPSWQNQRRPREVLEGAQDGAQPVPPVPIHPAPLRLHAPDGAAAPPQEDPPVPHLQKHPRAPQDLLLIRWRGMGRLNRNINHNATTFTASDCWVLIINSLFAD